MATTVVHPEKDQLKTIKAFLNALNIPFEESKGESLPKDVVKGIQGSQLQITKGSVTPYTGVDALLGL